MKALSIHQPWASLIASGKKTVEVRSWTTRHRGPLLICATKRPHGNDPVGVAVAIVNLLDVRRFSPGDARAARCEASPADYAWVLGDVRSIDPFPVTGNMGIFTVDAPELEVLVRPAKRGRGLRRRTRKKRRPGRTILDI
jgi:ASCH domain-containing protein